MNLLVKIIWDYVPIFFKLEAEILRVYESKGEIIDTDRPVWITCIVLHSCSLKGLSVKALLTETTLSWVKILKKLLLSPIVLAVTKL